MNSNDKKKILFDAVRRLAVAKGGDITKERIQIYAEYLIKYDHLRVLSALEKLFKTHLGFPDISKILEIVDPQPSEIDEANELAGAIIGAISAYGHNQVKEVKEYLGPKGWHVVERFGGWSNLCQIKNSELPTVRAQLRDLSKAHISMGERLPQHNEVPYKKESMQKIGDHLQDFKKLTSDQV